MIVNGLIADIDHLFVESQSIDEYRVYADGIVGGLSVSRFNSSLVENQLLAHHAYCTPNAKASWGPISVTSAIEQSSTARQLITTDNTLRLINLWGGISFIGNEVPYRAYGTGVFDAIQFTSDAGIFITVPDDGVRDIPIPPRYLVPGSTQRSGYLRLRPNSNVNAAVEIFFVQNTGAGAGGIIIWHQNGSLWETSTSNLTGTTGTDTKLTAGLNTAAGANVIQIENRTGGSLTFGWTWT